ncbi:MAG: M1 family metallopeptidase [Anaerolineae bacterium]
MPEVRMEIALDVAQRHMHVIQHVLLANGSRDRWQEIVFAVQPAHVPGVFELTEARVTTRRHRGEATTTLDGIMLHVGLPAPLSPGEPVSLTLSYAMHVPAIEPTTWLPEGNLGAGDRVYQAGDWHPTLVPYRDGEGWAQWTYHRVGDPTCYPIANYDVRITAPAGVVIAAPGRASQEGTKRRYQLDRARCFAFLASPDYVRIDDSVDGIPLQAYYLPESAESARALLEVTTQAIRLYSRLYGPYPTDGLVIAQNAYRGSMEYTGLISMSDQAYASHDGSPRSQLVSLTAHEVAHQWWYGAVGNDQVHEPWLDESLAKYSELLFYERYHPEPTDWWWDTQIHRFEPEGALDRAIYDFDDTLTYIRQLYGLGALFMQDLRELMGDEAFFEFLRDYRRSGEGRLVNGNVFFTTLDAHVTGDASPIITRYFNTHPGDLETHP